MKFFTPKLYLQFNSPNERLASAAEDAWEIALERYSQHLESLTASMPPSVKQLAALNLHDADFLSFETLEFPVVPQTMPDVPEGPSLAALSVKPRDEILTLIYVLWDFVQVHPRPRNRLFSRKQVHWLYEELDVAEADSTRFVHRILLSDGRILVIPFVTAALHRIPWHTSATNSRQSA